MGVVEMKENINAILLDNNSINKDKIYQIQGEELRFSQIDLITNSEQLHNIQDFSAYGVILINAEITWLEAKVFLKDFSNNYPSVARVVFNNQPVTITKNIDSVIGSLADNLHNFSDIIIFAIERASERMKYNALLQDYKLLIDTTPVGFFRSTEDGKLLLLNPALVELFEFENKEEMIKVQIKDLYYDPDKRKNVLETFRVKGYLSSQQEKKEWRSILGFYYS